MSEIFAWNSKVFKHHFYTTNFVYRAQNFSPFIENKVFVYKTFPQRLYDHGGFKPGSVFHSSTQKDMKPF